MSRLERIERDIERAQKRIAEWQSRLKELEGRLAEAENTEIVAAIRAMRMTQKELRAFIRTGTLPAGLEDRAAITPARFERKPKPRAAEAVKADTDAAKAEGDRHGAATDGKPKAATPAAATTDTDKESEVKTNGS
jgi:TolA-binding protein